MFRRRRRVGMTSPCASQRHLARRPSGGRPPREEVHCGVRLVQRPATALSRQAVGLVIAGETDVAGDPLEVDLVALATQVRDVSPGSGDLEEFGVGGSWRACSAALESLTGRWSPYFQERAWPGSVMLVSCSEESCTMSRTPVRSIF